MQTHSDDYSRTDGVDLLGEVVSLDEQVEKLEEQLVDAKARRDEMATEAVAAGVSKYSIAQATGRAISSVQRWVK